MSPRHFRWLVLSLLVLLILTGCNCSNAQVEAFEIIAESPIGGEIVSSLTPTFDWHANKSCQPDKYELFIVEDVLYGYDNVYTQFPGEGLPYTLSADTLLPGRSYYWHARALNEYTSPEDPSAYSPDSDEAHFFTGPVCSGEPLIAPELDYPLQMGGGKEYDNWITHTYPQKFKWTYTGGCLPVSYDYQFAADPGFTDIVLSGTTTKPYAQSTSQTFPNCSSLYWRVRANDGSSVGPWSEAWNFHWVLDPSCYQTHFISDDSARINVRLYEDVCSLTGYSSSSIVIPPGCIPSGGLIQADGVKTHQDHWMYQFDVDLGSGPCPSNGLDHKNNVFYDFFYVLTPGTYCVSITKSQTVMNLGASANLMHGKWTDPPTAEVVAMKTLELGPGLQDIELLFGWDPYDKKMVFFPLDVPTNCRIGPEPHCDPLGIPFEGEYLPIIARDRESEWKMTVFEEKMCFIYLPSAQLDEALLLMGEGGWSSQDLPFFDPQSPCPEPLIPRDCDSYHGQSSCQAAGCTWNWYNVTPGGGYCTD